MAGYTKLFSSIVTSTIWCEDLPTRIVWVAMLAMADAYGRVEGSVPGFARVANVTMEEMERALSVLKAPDPHSRTPDNDGRRIEPVSGGWRILNYEMYREKDARIRASLDMEGYVYYAGEPGGSTIKIGFSKNPWARLNDLRVVNPKLEILATEKATMAREKDRHFEFKAERTEGEWFRCSKSLMALIRALQLRDERATTVVKKATTVVTEAEADTDSEAVQRTPPSPEPGEGTGAAEASQTLDTGSQSGVTQCIQSASEGLPLAQEGPEAPAPGTGTPRNAGKAVSVRSARFVPPTPQEAEAYALTLGYKLDGERFVAHYQARGWKFKTGSPVVDWKACVVTWKKRDAQGGPHGAVDPKKRITGSAGYQPGKYAGL